MMEQSRKYSREKKGESNRERGSKKSLVMRKEGRVWKWRQAGKTKYRLHCSLKIPHHTAKRDVARGWCNVRSLVSTAPDILSQYYVYVRMTSMSSQQDDCSHLLRSILFLSNPFHSILILALTLFFTSKILLLLLHFSFSSVSIIISSASLWYKSTLFLPFTFHSLHILFLYLFSTSSLPFL